MKLWAALFFVWLLVPRLTHAEGRHEEGPAPHGTGRHAVKTTPKPKLLVVHCHSRGDAEAIEKLERVFDVVQLDALAELKSTPGKKDEDFIGRGQRLLDILGKKIDANPGQLQVAIFCHGLQAEELGLMITTDSLVHPQSFFLAGSELQSKLNEKLTSRKNVMVYWAQCGSGAMAGHLGPKARCILPAGAVCAACPSGSTVYLTHFTHNLLKGLKEVCAEHPGKREVTAGDLKAWALEKEKMLKAGGSRADRWLDELYRLSEAEYQASLDRALKVVKNIQPFARLLGETERKGESLREWETRMTAFIRSKLRPLVVEEKILSAEAWDKEAPSREKEKEGLSFDEGVGRLMTALMESGQAAERRLAQNDLTKRERKQLEKKRTSALMVFSSLRAIEARRALYQIAGGKRKGGVAGFREAFKGLESGSPYPGPVVWLGGRSDTVVAPCP